MTVKDFNVSSAERAWQAFQRSIGVAAIHTPKEYARAVALTHRLLDVVGEDESHPLAGLLDLVGELVAAYEAREQPLPDAAPGEETFHSGGLMFSLLGTSDPQTLREWFRRLAEGAAMVDDLRVRPWGATDGQVIDRHGVHWLIGFEDEPSQLST